MTSLRQHPYVDRKGGRTIKSVPPRGHQTARLTCRKCGGFEEIGFRQIPDAGVIDAKYHARGWKTDPAVCPECIKTKRENKMSATPSPGAIAAQAKMINLLQAHFDPDTGRYAPGWSDNRVAKETGQSPEYVAALRDEAFGKIKEPAELIKLQQDVDALEQLIEDAVAPIRSELGEIKARLQHLRAQF